MPPLLRTQRSRPEVAAVEDVDEQGNTIAGSGRYARSTAAPSPPPANPSKALMNTSKKKSSSSRRASEQYDYESDIMPSPDSPPAEPRREHKSEKRRPSISTKQPKGVVENGKSKRPAARSSKTMPMPGAYPNEAAYYGVPSQTTPAPSRPRAQTRPASYYPGMPGMPGGPSRPPLSNPAMYYGPPGPMGPLGFPPGSFHGPGGPGGPGMHPMGPPPPHMMMAQSPMSAGPGPMPSPGGYFPPSGAPETLASRFHRGQEHRPRSAIGFHGSPGHYEDYGEYMEEAAPAPAPRGGLVRRQSVSQAPPKRQPKEIEPRDMGPPAPPRRPQTARPQSMSLPYRPQPLSIMKSAHFHGEEADEDSGMIPYSSSKRASGHGFDAYEYGKSSVVAPRRHRRSSFDDSSDLDDEDAYHREPAAAPERRSASSQDKLKKAMKYQSEVAGPSVPMVADTHAHTAALTHDALRRRNGASSRSSHSSDSHDESSYKQSAATRTTRDSDDGINVKVSGDATVEIGNTKINFSGGGGEMTIGRGNSNNNNGGSDRGTDRGTEYGGDDRKSRADRTERPSRARAQSQAGSTYPRSHYDPNMPPGYGGYPPHLAHHPSQRVPHHAMQYAPQYGGHPGYAPAASEFGDFDEYEPYYPRH